MNYENILQFKGTWRVYQARVLDRAEHYVRDGKIHIVAAPGSGKTTLGIEPVSYTHLDVYKRQINSRDGIRYF